MESESSRSALRGHDAPPERLRAQGFLFLAGFGLCIPAANWLIGNAGTVCLPEGPCLIPVAPGIMAPSGVVMIGLALVLRDLVQRRLGLSWAAGAILVGAALSALLAPPALVVASAVSFLLSELADLAVYTPLQRRRLILAVVASSLEVLSSTACCFCSWPSAAWSSSSARSSARAGWCCSPCPSSGGCASTTAPAASSRPSSCAQYRFQTEQRRLFDGGGP